MAEYEMKWKLITSEEKLECGKKHKTISNCYVCSSLKRKHAGYHIVSFEK
jgi:hypothetical protein